MLNIFIAVFALTASMTFQGLSNIAIIVAIFVIQSIFQTLNIQGNIPAAPEVAEALRNHPSPPVLNILASRPVRYLCMLCELQICFLTSILPHWSVEAYTRVVYHKVFKNHIVREREERLKEEEERKEMLEREEEEERLKEEGEGESQEEAQEKIIQEIEREIEEEEIEVRDRRGPAENQEIREDY